MVVSDKLRYVEVPEGRGTGSVRSGPGYRRPSKINTNTIQLYNTNTSKLKSTSYEYKGRSVGQGPWWGGCPGKPGPDPDGRRRGGSLEASGEAGQGSAWQGDGGWCWRYSSGDLATGEAGGGPTVTMFRSKWWSVRRKSRRSRSPDGSKWVKRRSEQPGSSGKAWWPACLTWPPCGPVT